MFKVLNVVNRQSSDGNQSNRDSVSRASIQVTAGSQMGIGIPLFSKRFPFTQGSCEIPSLSSVHSLLKISTPTQSGTSQKHGKGQADGGGQAFHGGIMANNVGEG